MRGAPALPSASVVLAAAEWCHAPNTHTSALGLPGERTGDGVKLGERGRTAFFPGTYRSLLEVAENRKINANPTGNSLCLPTVLLACQCQVSCSTTCCTNCTAAVCRSLVRVRWLCGGWLGVRAKLAPSVTWRNIVQKRDSPRTIQQSRRSAPRVPGTLLYVLLHCRTAVLL